MQILGLLGMYFDAVVVEVEKYLLFSDWIWPYCVANLIFMHLVWQSFLPFLEEEHHHSNYPKNPTEILYFT